MRPHRRKPTRLPHPWDPPGKKTGVGYHFLLQCMKVKSQSEVAQSCPTLSDPMDCSPPGSSVPGILQARKLEWVAISFSNAWKWKVKGKSLSRVRLFATPWTAAHQAPWSIGLSRQEYWNGLPLPSLNGVIAGWLLCWSFLPYNWLAKGSETFLFVADTFGHGCLSILRTGRDGERYSYMLRHMRKGNISRKMVKTST